MTCAKPTSQWQQRFDHVKSMTCEDCGKCDASVHERYCGFMEDTQDDPNWLEVVCDECEQRHCEEI